MDRLEAPARWGRESARRADVLLPPAPRSAVLSQAQRRLLVENMITRPDGWAPAPLYFYWDTDPDQPGAPDTGGEIWDDTYKWGR